MGTQMISQLNKIYTNEVVKTITGLCGTKIVMSTPEPETAKYMSNFLGEKEEISTNESISYGANTMHDNVNISRRPRKNKLYHITKLCVLNPVRRLFHFPERMSLVR